MNTLQRALIVALIGIAYLIPSLMAHANHHRHEKSIVLLNLLLGWTGIGWIAAMIWAASGRSADELRHVSQEGIPDSGFCADCGSPLEARASFCPGCGARPRTPAATT